MKENDMITSEIDKLILDQIKDPFALDYNSLVIEKTEDGYKVTFTYYDYE